jgi:hypothetical protein
MPAAAAAVHHQVVLRMMEEVSNEDYIRMWAKKLAPPLVTLLSAEPEVQYVALRNINLIVQRWPQILSHEVKVRVQKTHWHLISRCCFHNMRVGLLLQKPAAPTNPRTAWSWQMGACSCASLCVGLLCCAGVLLQVQ